MAKFQMESLIPSNAPNSPADNTRGQFLYFLITFVQNSFITFIPAQTQTLRLSTRRSMRRTIFHQQTFHPYRRKRGHFPLSKDIKLNSLWPVIVQFGSYKIKSKKNICVWGGRDFEGQKEKVKWKFNDAINWPKFSLMFWFYASHPTQFSIP